jgi:hypothetical protein
MADTTVLKALKWNECSSTMAHQLTATTYLSDKVYECPTSALPMNFQNIPGLSAVYLSGYCRPLEVFPSLSATGELVCVRFDAEASKVKTYNFVFAKTDDNRIFWQGPFRNFDLHHIDLDCEVPIDNIFCNNPFAIAAS